MKQNTIVEIISALFIFLFIYAAITKLLDYHTFRMQLGQSPFITQFVDWISWLLPILEIGIVILLILPRTRLIGFYSSFFIMLLFSEYIYVMLHYSYHIPCSCGGILSKMSWQQHLVFNIAFTLIALFGIFLQLQKQINNKPINEYNS